MSYSFGPDKLAPGSTPYSWLELSLATYNQYKPAGYDSASAIDVLGSMHVRKNN